MGSRGTFAAGKQAAYTYETVGKVDGVKIINPIDKSKSLKLPEESHSSVGYVLYDKDGVFHQYREYNSNHEIVLEIGYHHEKSLGHGDILHVHVHNTPGVEHHGQADKFVIKPGHPLYEKYKKLFKGVKQ